MDGNGGQIKKLFFSKGNKRVEKKHPEIGEIIRRRYSELRNLEKVECDSVDMVCEPFSQMMVELCNAALAGTKYGKDGKDGEEKFNGVEQLAYYLGKWIYLIDALDDYDKDIKEKNYNPFYFCFGKEPDFGLLLKIADRTFRLCSRRFSRGLKKRLTSANSNSIPRSSAI